MFFPIRKKYPLLYKLWKYVVPLQKHRRIKVNEKEENLEMDCVGNGLFPGDDVCGDVGLQSDGCRQCGGEELG